MSLINDALKRATSLRKKELASGTERLPPLEPVSEKPGKSKGLVMILGALFILALGYFAWTQLRGNSDQTTAQGVSNTSSNRSSVAAQTKTDSGAAPATNATQNPLARAAAIAETLRAKNEAGSNGADQMQPANSAQAGAIPVTESSVEVAGANSIEPTANSDSSIDFPPVSLQAIYFRSRNPSAVINGKTIREGDEIEGVKVGQISRDQIRLEYQGQSKIVSLK